MCSVHHSRCSFCGVFSCICNENLREPNLESSGSVVDMEPGEQESDDGSWLAADSRAKSVNWWNLLNVDSEFDYIDFEDEEEVSSYLGQDRGGAGGESAWEPEPVRRKSPTLIPGYARWAQASDAQSVGSVDSGLPRPSHCGSELFLEDEPEIVLECRCYQSVCQCLRANEDPYEYDDIFDASVQDDYRRDSMDEDLMLEGNVTPCQLSALCPHASIPSDHPCFPCDDIIAAHLFCLLFMVLPVRTPLSHLLVLKAIVFKNTERL